MAFHMTEGEASGPHIVQDAPYFRENSQFTYQEESQHSCGKQAGQGDVKISRSEKPRKESHIRTRFLKESRKNTRLKQQGYHRDQYHTNTVDEPFGYHRTQGLGKETPSYLAKIPQRETSPTRGTTRLAA